MMKLGDTSFFNGYGKQLGDTSTFGYDDISHKQFYSHGGAQLRDSFNKKVEDLLDQ